MARRRSFYCRVIASLAALSLPICAQAGEAVAGASIDFSQKREVSAPGIWGQGARVLVAPVAVPLDAGYRLYQGESAKDVIMEDGKYVLGYATLVYGGGKLIDSYFRIGFRAFNEAAIDKRII